MSFMKPEVAQVFGSYYKPYQISPLLTIFKIHCNIILKSTLTSTKLPLSVVFL